MWDSEKIAKRKAEIEAEFQRVNAERLRLEAIARSLADRLCELRGQVQALEEIESSAASKARPTG